MFQLYISIEVNNGQHVLARGALIPSIFGLFLRVILLPDVIMETFDAY